MISSLARFEYRVLWRKRLPMVAAGIGVYAVAVVLFLLRSLRAGAPGGFSSAELGERALIDVSMLACGVVLVFVPALTAGTVASSRGILRYRLDAAARGTAVDCVVAMTIYPLLSALVLVAASGIPLLVFGALTRTLALGPLAFSHMILWLFAVAVIALGSFASWLVLDDHAAIGLVYLVFLVVAAAPILAGPLISWLPADEALVNSMLVTNPFAAVASVIGYDIARAEIVYVWSPVGQERFSYPSFATSSFFLFSVSLISFSGATLRVRRLRVRPITT